MRAAPSALEAFAEVFGKGFNTKVWPNGCRPPPAPTGVCAGLEFCAEGVRVASHIEEAVRFCLTMEQKTLNDMQHVYGAILFFESAFKFDPSDQLHIGELKAHINDRGDGKRFKQTQQSKDACATLLSIIERSPRATTDPRAMLQNHRCMVFMSDCGKYSTAQSFHLVDAPCVTLVTLEMLKDSSMTRLIATKNKLRPKNAKGWHAWEGELKGMVDNCDDYGGLVETALLYQQAWAAKHHKEVLAVKRKLGLKDTDELKKVGFFVDAQTAMGKWRKLILPDACQEHLAAKNLRFIGWVIKVARTAYWPCIVKWYSGLLISLCHLMSHMSDLIEERRYCQQREQQLRNDPGILERYELSVANHVEANATHSPNDEDDTYVCTQVTTAVSSHEKQTSPMMFVMPSLTLPTAHTIKPEDPPDLRRLVYDPVILDMSPAEAAEIVRAGKADAETTVHGVPLSLMYKYYTEGKKAEGLPAGLTEDKKRMNAWAGVRFFVHPHPGTTHDMLFTLAQTTRYPYSDGLVSCNVKSNKLVPVIPKYAAVKTTMLVSGDGSAKMSSALWASNDMRKQCLLMAHECCGHQKPNAMYKTLQMMVWWPTMKADCDKHYLVCAVCEPLQKRQDHPGLSVACAQRWRVIVVDLKIMPFEIGERTGVPAILTTVDMATSFTVYSPLADETVIEVAVAIYSTVVAYFGLSTVVRHDPGSQLVAQAMKMVMELLGIVQVPGAVDDHHHAAHAETGHKEFDMLMKKQELRGELRGSTRVSMNCVETCCPSLDPCTKTQCVVLSNASRKDVSHKADSMSSSPSPRVDSTPRWLRLLGTAADS